MKIYIIMFPASIFFGIVLFAQEPIISTFDYDNEGWTVDGGNMYYHNMNGNPGGFIEFEDDQDGAGLFTVPANFLGNLSSYHQGSIKFDLKNTIDNGQNLLYGFGKISISSPAITASRIVVPFEYIDDWTSFTIPLEAEEWGLGPASWDSLLSEVIQISVQMDGQWEYYDRSGLDNFAIVPYGTGMADENSGAYKPGKVLNRNFPNPFSESTTISWKLDRSCRVRLAVYDMSGLEVSLLIDEYQGPGYHEIIFHPGDLPDGIYLYHIRTHKYFDANPMILMRK